MRLGAEQPGEQLDVGDHRVDLLGADDRARHDRRPGPQRGCDEAPATEPLQLVAVLEVLAEALVTLGEDGGQLTRGEQPVGVVRARHGVAGLARGLAEHRHVEDHVRGQQPQVAVCRMVVAHRHRRHQPVERQHPGVVCDHKGGAGLRKILDAADLNAEPRLEEHSQQRQKDCVVEMRIKPELVNGVVAHHSLADELRHRGDFQREFVRSLLDCRGARGGAPALVDLADDGGDLLGRSTAAAVGEKRGMSAGTIRARARRRVVRPTFGPNSCAAE